MTQTAKRSPFTMNVDLMHGPIFKSLVVFMLPIFVSNLFQQLYNTVDTMIVGNVLGDTALAAIGSCGSIYELLVGFGLGIGNGLAIVAARSYGAQDHDLLKKTVAGSLVIGLIASLCITLAGAVGLRPLLVLLDTPAEILEDAYRYIIVIDYGVLVMFAYNLCAGLLRAIGNSFMPLVFLLLSSGLNILLDLLFIARMGMGVQGAAIATLVSQLLNFLLILLGFVVYLRRDASHPLWTLHFERITLRAYGGMILPILLSEFLWSLGQNVESAVYGHLGTANLAAYTLTCPIQSLIVGALSGLSAAAGVMVGKHLGKKTYDAAYGDARRIMLTGLVGAIGVASLLVLFAGAYTNLYRVDADVQTLGKALLVVFALYAPVKVENMILSGGILRSGGNTRVIMIIDTIGTWGIGIPLCLLAAFGLHWGIVGVYALLTTEEIFRLAVSLVIFKKRSWMISL